VNLEMVTNAPEWLMGQLTPVEGLTAEQIKQGVRNA